MVFFSVVCFSSSTRRFPGAHTEHTHTHTHTPSTHTHTHTHTHTMSSAAAPAASKVVVITGASSGIGAALGELLASQGYRVVLVARREPELQAVAARCAADKALVVVADVTKREDVKRTVATTLEKFGQIDVWVNNAGRGISRMPSQLTDDDMDDMMTVNVKSAMYGVQEVLPHFKERNAGHVINISSLLGRIVFPLRSAYCGAKHFLNALTESLRLELQSSHPGIAVSLVSPGVVHTDFGLNAKHGGPDSRSMPGQSAEEVAAIIAKTIETRKPDVYTPPNGHAIVTKYYNDLDQQA